MVSPARSTSTRSGPWAAIQPAAVRMLASWRTGADARSFAATPLHRAAVRDLYKQRWQYSHFSAIWEITHNHGRVIFCDKCEGITAASERVCSGCGAELTDIYRRAPNSGG